MWSSDERKTNSLLVCVETVLAATRVNIARDTVIGYLRSLDKYGILHSGRRGEVLVAATVFLLTRKNRALNQTSLLDVAHAVDTSVRAVFDVVKKIQEVDDGMKDVDITTDPNYHANILMNSSNVHISPTVRDSFESLLYSLIEIVMETDSQSGRRVVATVGSIFEITCGYFNITYDKKDIAARCGVSQATIEVRYEELSVQLLRIVKRMSGSRRITADNVCNHLRYIVEVAIPFMKQCSVCPLMEHPKFMKEREVRQKRTKQIDHVKEMMKKSEQFALGTEERLIENMLKCGMSEAVIIQCTDVAEMRRQYMMFRRKLQAAKELEDVNDSTDVNAMLGPEEAPNSE